MIANTAYLFAVYFGFVHISLILFKRTNDFSNIWRAAQMTMGFTAGMYTSTDLRVIHPWRGKFIYIELLCKMNFIWAYEIARDISILFGQLKAVLIRSNLRLSLSVMQHRL